MRCFTVCDKKRQKNIQLKIFINFQLKETTLRAALLMMANATDSEFIGENGLPTIANKSTRTEMNPVNLSGTVRKSSEEMVLKIG